MVTAIMTAIAARVLLLSPNEVVVGQNVCVC